MIQVIARLFQSLEFMAESKALSPKKLSDKTGLKKTTLFTILKTTTSLGYLEQDGEGNYHLSPKFIELTGEKNRMVLLKGLAEERLKKLSAETGEASVFVVYEEGLRRCLVQHPGNHLITVNAKVMEDEDFFSYMSGRILLAWIDADERKKLLKRIGLPGEVWPDVKDVVSLETALSGLKNDAVHTLERGELTTLGVAVVRPEKKLYGVLGLYLPTSRFRDEHRARSLAALESAAGQFRNNLSDF